MDQRYMVIGNVTRFVVAVLDDMPDVSHREKAEMFTALMPRIAVLLTVKREVKVGIKIGSHYVAMNIVVED